LAVPYVVNITNEGDRAKAAALIHDQQVELEMQRSGDGWRVVAVHDDALVQRLMDEVVKTLPGLGGDDNSDLGKRLKKLQRSLPSLPSLR